MTPAQQKAVHEAAEAVLDHSGPDAHTDPNIAVDAMGRAIDTGATHRDIAAEIGRIRG